jgi:hypothetical protein
LTSAVKTCKRCGLYAAKYDRDLQRKNHKLTFIVPTLWIALFAIIRIICTV